MLQYNANNLIVHQGNSPDPGVMVEVTPEIAGWDYIHFQVRRLEIQQSWAFNTYENELAIVVLGGTMNVGSNRGRWPDIGQRKDVFSGLPFALYLPPHTSFTVTAVTACDFAVAWVSADQEHSPRLITPSDVEVEIRGGDNATRQINSLLPPGFPCQRLVIVEVYTPGGNWSSYPPHKHDIHKTGPGGDLLEADLEEVYYYKIDPPDGYALQRVYTAPESPLHRAGFPIDSVLLLRGNDVALIPEGYHPVSSPPGYTTYYLNVLAGSAQSLANSDDPQYSWIKESYRAVDPRVPLYDISLKSGRAR